MIPHSLELEMSVLGSMMMSDSALQRCKSILRHADFFRPAHQLIFTAICQLSDKGRAVDFVLIKDLLASEKVLTHAGGEDYLIQIADFVPSAANAESYAVRVRELSERRETIKQARELLELAGDTEKPMDEVRAMRSSMDVIRGTGSPYTAFAEIPMRKDRRRGVSTGFPELDGAISTGGYPSGQMSIVSAYHKGKKTSFLLSSMLQQLNEGKRVLFATFADLGREDLKERMVRNICGYGREPAVDWAQEEFHKAVIHVDTALRGGIYDASTLETGDDIETFSAWFKAEHSREPFDSVLMDYAQKLTSSDKRAFGDLAMPAMVSRKICRLAAATRVPFVLASQITEGTKDGRKAMTKGARVWEEDAGWVLRLTEDNEVEIAYSRFGEQGKVIPMAWNKFHLRFEAAA